MWNLNLNFQFNLKNTFSISIADYRNYNFDTI